jgi:hypothetical protein
LKKKGIVTPYREVKGEALVGLNLFQCNFCGQHFSSNEAKRFGPNVVCQPCEKMCERMKFNKDISREAAGQMASEREHQEYVGMLKEAKTVAEMNLAFIVKDHIIPSLMEEASERLRPRNQRPQ